MPQLHELLAVDSNLKNQTEKARTELRKTFTDKHHLFTERKIVTIPLQEGQSASTEVQSDIQTNVTSELKWLSGILTKSLDVSFQIAQTNRNAVADIVLENGEILAKDVPATALLELEKRIAEMRDLISSIPTLDPAKGFTPDPDRGVGIFKAREVKKPRTQKIQKALVLYPATTEHPAQTQLVSVDEKVADIVEQEWSSRVTVAAKAELFDRAEAVLQAVKQARARANDIKVDTGAKIGAAVTKAVFGV